MVEPHVADFAADSYKMQSHKVKSSTVEFHSVSESSSGSLPSIRHAIPIQAAGNVLVTPGGSRARTPYVMLYKKHDHRLEKDELLVNFKITVLVGGLSLDCVTPPMECPNTNITFWLYTRSTQNKPHELKASNNETITSASWVKDAPVKILIHGYTGHKDFSPNTEIRPAYMECCDYNIISVDYNPIAREPCYFQAATNVQLVGQCTAQLIDVLVEKHKFPLSVFHVVGFSLGGQAAGAISNYLKSGMLDRVTGLDPAMPLFVTNDKKKKLDAGDARAVDVLHTNALEKGKLEQSGTSDFYANGGLGQPGCQNSEMGKSGCDHARACLYFAESINSKLGFYGTRCLSWISYMIGWCEFYNAEEEVLFGEYTPLNATGIYFFRTNSESPYARGSNKKKEKREGYDARMLDGPDEEDVTDIDYQNEYDAKDKGKYLKLSTDNGLVQVVSSLEKTAHGFSDYFQTQN